MNLLIEDLKTPRVVRTEYRLEIIAGEESGENSMTLRDIAAQKKRTRNV